MKNLALILVTLGTLAICHAENAALDSTQQGESEQQQDDVKRASWADMKRASWADMKRASWADMKRASWSDMKRASWADMKRASWADMKRSAKDANDFRQTLHEHIESLSDKQLAKLATLLH